MHGAVRELGGGGDAGLDRALGAAAVPGLESRPREACTKIAPSGNCSPVVLSVSESVSVSVSVPASVVASVVVASVSVPASESVASLVASVSLPASVASVPAVSLALSIASVSVAPVSLSVALSLSLAPLAEAEAEAEAEADGSSVLRPSEPLTEALVIAVALKFEVPSASGSAQPASRSRGS